MNGGARRSCSRCQRLEGINEEKGATNEATVNVDEENVYSTRIKHGKNELEWSKESLTLAGHCQWV